MRQSRQVFILFVSVLVVCAQLSNDAAFGVSITPPGDEYEPEAYFGANLLESDVQITNRMRRGGDSTNLSRTTRPIARVSPQ